ncbi:MAG: Slp family lipoprotein [Desulfobacteraceae bacterium]|nr:Slp family lipoprotein [Desulfobacteraceae bacterium]
MMRIIVVIVIAAILFSGCAHVISEDVLKEVNTDINFAELRKNPLAYQGEMVLLGGVIVKVVYKQDRTLLEIYQTEMDREERPVSLDVSGGRFLAKYDGFLDRAIYRKGREVTVAGKVKGVKVMKLGEIDYHYPYILIRGIHLWKEKKPEIYEPYPWYPMGPWGMWGPWGPWYYPYRRY